MDFLAQLIKGVVVIVLVILGFIFHDQIGMETSVIALTAAAVMLIIGGVNVDNAIQDVEWTTIAFFMALFVVVGGLTETGYDDVNTALGVSAAVVILKQYTVYSDIDSVGSSA